jgi:hypothetical protein
MKCHYQYPGAASSNRVVNILENLAIHSLEFQIQFFCFTILKLKTNQREARFEVFWAVTTKSTIFWGVTPCNLAELSNVDKKQNEDRGSMLLRKVGPFSTFRWPINCTKTSHIHSLFSFAICWFCCVAYLLHRMLTLVVESVPPFSYLLTVCDGGSLSKRRDYRKLSAAYCEVSPHFTWIAGWLIQLVIQKLHNDVVLKYMLPSWNVA